MTCIQVLRLLRQIRLPRFLSVHAIKLSSILEKSDVQPENATILISTDRSYVFYGGLVIWFSLAAVESALQLNYRFFFFLKCIQNIFVLYFLVTSFFALTAQCPVEIILRESYLHVCWWKFSTYLVTQVDASWSCHLFLIPKRWCHALHSGKINMSA